MKWFVLRQQIHFVLDNQMCLKHDEIASTTKGHVKLFDVADVIQSTR